MGWLDKLWPRRQSRTTDDMLKRGKLVEEKLDEHVKAFLLEFAVPGVPFRVTMKQGEVEWEVTEEE